MLKKDNREFYCEYDLIDARKVPQKSPARHQAESIDHLIEWYKNNTKSNAGGILVLPTGGGKTFTAIRFICLKALSDGYKVLWLAHTNHLLEQAYYSFENHVGSIADPKRDLKVRVVSGTIGHFHVADICSGDDVVIATLQTITKAYKENHFAVNDFINSAKGKLFVIFDEAHHAPAPSYRRLILNLRDRCAQMHLLGLTATPVYSDENLQGWLAKLFPQGILYQVTPQELMAEGILAKPIHEQQNTEFQPDFDLAEYQKWVGTFRDLPEDIITQLAENKNRNASIAEHYFKNKEKYGKTLIFADRWFQCEAISEYLRHRGVRTGTVYTHIDADPGSASARNKRKSDENARVLDAFRRNELDVVLNVRMLTEGTDIPDVKTCFITRQTTSKILLTQMVGRALRGPKFGGTPEAYMVFFTDNWEQLINWAEYDLVSGGADENERDYEKRPPLRYISIELVRKLASQMDSGVNISPPFKTLLPVGWYRVEYSAKQTDTEEIEPVRRLVMVFDHELEGYENLIKELLSGIDQSFYEEGVQYNDVQPLILDLQRRFFPCIDEHFGSNLSQDIFSIARHIAQIGAAPKFFNFEERDRHNLDLVAEDLIGKDLTRRQEDDALRLEFNRQDRYWQVLYVSYELFKSQYNGCVERILHARRHGIDPENHQVKVTTSSPQDREPSKELKQQVKERDGKCLCCGTKNSRSLEVDHILSKYFGGSNILDNLQTLCSKCNNQLKGTDRINFLDCQTDLTMAPHELPKFEMPSGRNAADPFAWEEFLSKTVNFFYRCGAVNQLTIGRRGEHFYNWQIKLNAGNDPRWLQPHLKFLLDLIIKSKEEGGYVAPNSITLIAPDLPSVIFRV